MEKKNMMLSTAKCRKNNPPPPKQVRKTAPVARSSNCNVKKRPQAQNKGKGKAPAPKQPGLQNPKHSEGCHGKCISDGQNNDGITEKGGSQIKISETISYIFDSIPGLY
ncbi:hypothetical protein O181_079227 [Austropuccinia psidii MF-1]|uniref:Uncharacterized protein n=1 Tax=Austropuccinia psidii MF-1 TaxID=1389203 RepID=A0A9Q3FJA3_9BASI|nr:hypothetical protein [Austropuccinia psidii MF-1]